MSNNTSLPVISAETGFYQYLQKINKIPSLSPEEEFLLAKSYLDNQDLEAAHRLVTSHLKLVAKIAISYRNYGLPLSELVSEGNLGLMQAVKKYNPDLGFRLSTYAMWWIKAAIQEYVLKSWSLVKIGTTAAQKKLFFSLGKIKQKITKIYSRAVTEQDFTQIASELGVSRNEVSEMNSRLAGPDLSLNNLVNNSENSGGELIEFLPEPRLNQELKLISRQDSVKKQNLLAQAMKLLNPRELHILTERKLKDLPTTLDMLSIEYNISKERIRQIENAAFEKVKEFMLKHMAKYA
ncbi:RNA polymerase sigma factor RpoH [Candidatus Tisiphia endosymbiont of Beris chalybata]|uniref:RNA polymerase sigma factor RpoH n=1 Tax=Candidatus Tisiphia endosymbiont of Beris chalybata TaxID=3066262 RepID=UPI00312C881E